MFDILTYLLENYPGINACPQISTLTLKLKQRGFSDHQITKALCWLSELLNDLELYGQKVRFHHEGYNVRLFSHQEKQKLDEDCFKLITALEAASLLSPVLRELIIERCIAIDDLTLNVEQFKIVILMVLWSQNQREEHFMVSDLVHHENHFSIQ